MNRKRMYFNVLAYSKQLYTKYTYKMISILYNLFLSLFPSLLFSVAFDGVHQFVE